MAVPVPFSLSGVLLTTKFAEYPFFLRVLAPDLPDPEREVRLIDGKASRCDFVWQQQKVVVECEGGTWTGGRHTTGVGFRDDCKKYNALTLLGYRVLRFTSDMLNENPQECIEQVRFLLTKIE